MAKQTCAREECENPRKSARALYCDARECERARSRERMRKSAARARDARASEESDTTAAGDATMRMAGGVFSATLAELTSAGRVGTSAGQNALALASRIDFSAADTGSSIAALSKQHLAAMTEALKDADHEGDLVDELTARRQQRAGA